MSKKTDDNNVEARLFKITIKGITPYSNSALVMEEKKKGETDIDYEKRVWRHRLRADKDGRVYHNGRAFFYGLVATSKYSDIKRQGKAKYTKHFDQGVQNMGQMYLEPPVYRDDVEGEWFHVPSNGERQGPKRVPKCFPVIHEWGGTFELMVFDPAITKDILVLMLTEMGKLNGIGRFRPERGGFYGRFIVTDIVEEAT